MKTTKSMPDFVKAYPTSIQEYAKRHVGLEGGNEMTRSDTILYICAQVLKELESVEPCIPEKSYLTRQFDIVSSIPFQQTSTVIPQTELTTDEECRIMEELRKVMRAYQKVRVDRLITDMVYTVKKNFFNTNVIQITIKFQAQ